MLGIRVDANDKIAMGHLMRCLSIACQLKCMNQEVLFIVSEQYPVSQIEEAGFQCICLHNSYKDKETELPELLGIIEAYGIDKILIDSYEATPHYMSAIQLSCKVIYIDDINKFRYPADLIINYTFKTDMSLYAKWNYEKEVFLLGEQYVPLRPAFTENPIRIKDKVENIFLTTGGTDEYDMLTGLLEALQENEVLRSIQKHVVAGKFYKNFAGLNQIADKNSMITLYHNISDIWNVMRKCDVAISAGGTTLAELCACGIPSVCFAIAENQLPGIRAYAAEEMMLYAGNVMQERDSVIQNVVMETEKLVGGYSERRYLAQKANFFIDGKGATRISEHIISL